MFKKPVKLFEDKDSLNKTKDNLSVYLFVITKGIAQIFKVEDYKPLVSSFGMLIFVTSLWVFPSAVKEIEWLHNTNNLYFVLPLHVVVPLMLLIISVIRKRRKSVLS